MGFALGVAMTLLWPGLSGETRMASSTSAPATIKPPATVKPPAVAIRPVKLGDDDANTTEVGADWVNDYHGWANGLSACDDDTVGFYNVMKSKGWAGSFCWGNDNAWEKDFKSVAKGGSDDKMSDNADLVYFSGHGNTSGFYVGSTKDDHQIAWQDCEWGDKDLEWIAVSSCQCLNIASQPWTTWGWAFKGLHTMLGMDTTEYDTPNLGKYFAQYMTQSNPKMTIVQAWRQAAIMALPYGEYCAAIGVNESGYKSINDCLPGYGAQAPDNYDPWWFWWVRYSCG